MMRAELPLNLRLPAATAMLSSGLHNLPAWQLNSLGVRLQTATISQLAERLRSANVQEAGLDFILGQVSRALYGGGRTSTAERAELQRRLLELTAKQRAKEQEAQKRTAEIKNTGEVALRIQSLLAAIATLQRAIEEALRTFALETAAALTIVLLALQAELKNLISQPGIVST
jgi:hypothetical protein